MYFLRTAADWSGSPWIQQITVHRIQYCESTPTCVNSSEYKSSVTSCNIPEYKLINSLVEKQGLHLCEQYYQALLILFEKKKTATYQIEMQHNTSVFMYIAFSDDIDFFGLDIIFHLCTTQM